MYTGLSANSNRCYAYKLRPKKLANSVSTTQFSTQETYTQPDLLSGISKCILFFENPLYPPGRDGRKDRRRAEGRRTKVSFFFPSFVDTFKLSSLVAMIAYAQYAA